jgi:Asp-tRNA(Asn)/Glu-tRNA(Gln) amidotransferase A subunit family amidase
MSLANATRAAAPRADPGWHDPVMADRPWQRDACSLVDAFRSGDRSPTEELQATLAAIEASELNAFGFVDPERALQAAENADVSKPFGGVPTGIKELEPVRGWPFTEGSLVFRDRVADHTTVHLERLFHVGGAVPVGLTTASEFGGLNVSQNRLHGVTHNPWRHGRTTGGSSGGSAAAVAGGLVALGTGGDGGGSIRIPAGYTGLLGMKGTFGRIPRSPHAYSRPNTIVLGTVARSVRDAARYYDVCCGYDARDPSSLPKHPGFESGLGVHVLRGRRVAIVPSLGGVPLDAGVEEHLRARAASLIAATGMVQVDLGLELPNLAAQWMMGNTATLLADLGARWPGCAAELTPDVALGLYMAQSLYNLRTAAVAESLRLELNEAMARALDRVDFIIAATNPGPAFAAEAEQSSRQESFIDWAKASTPALYTFRSLLFGTRLTSVVAPKLPTFLLEQAARRFPELVNMGGLTLVSNIYGNPAVSIPAGTVDGLPVGMQVLARHHADDLLLDVALAAERTDPWPLVAPDEADALASPGFR